MPAKPKRVVFRPGAKLPNNTVYVGRPSRWGNPHRIGPNMTRAEVVAAYRCDLMKDSARMALAVAELQGKNLACWCGLDEPCHADVLLEIANE